MVAAVTAALTWFITAIVEDEVPSPLAFLCAVIFGAVAFLPLLRGLMLMLAWPLMIGGAL